jgi:hypothetical protein
MNRKRVILAALLGVLVICIVYAYVTTPQLEKAPPRTESRRVRTNVKAMKNLKPESAQERINFDFLTVEPQDFTGAKRDIFRFGQRSPVRTEPPVVKIEAPVPIMNVAVLPEPAVVPFAEVQQSLGEFTFLGFLEKSGEKTVFLSSGGNLFLVKRGEIFGADQEFQVDSIDGNLLRVRHSGRDGLVEIPLVDQQKLNASASAPAHIEPAAKAPSQPGQRTFTPKRRMLRPAAPRETENPFQKPLEMNNPEDEQKAEFPAAGDALEEKVNGTNQ